MTRRNSKGRHGEIYPSVLSDEGVLCVKRDPLFISADRITAWWLSYHQVSSYKQMATHFAAAPINRTQLLKELTHAFYHAGQGDDTPLFLMVKQIISKTLGFKVPEEEE